MSHAAAKTVLTGCLAPIDKDGLDTLIAKGKADPKVIKTLKCKTVAEGSSIRALWAPDEDLSSGWIDCRDLGAVFEHEGPLPHPKEDSLQ